MLHPGADKERVLLEITCGDTAGLLRRLTQQGISLFDVVNLDYLTLRFACEGASLPTVKALAHKLGTNVRILSDRSALVYFISILKRPVMVAAFFLLAFLVLFLPTRVLFVRVEGNLTCPAKQILEEAEDCGICFGASRRAVRSEKMKNALLEAMPQLQWAGINTSGCVATISVREKTQAQEPMQMEGSGSIIAKTDGVIQSCTVENGTALCRVGEAVTAGQTLISGYTDCGIAIKSVRARGEITASTIRNLQAVAHTQGLARTDELHIETKYSLQIGKKLINFFQDSGISDTTCVKMYSQKYLTLPGGFQLPIALVVQKDIYYAAEPAFDAQTQQWLADYCQAYLLEHLQAGQILSKNIQLEQTASACFLYGEYICLENIGQFVNEEIIKDDGQTN